MSQKPYDNLSHLEGALRRVYAARRSLSHIDAGVVETDEFELLAGIVTDLEELEESFEERASEKRVKKERIRPDREERL